MRFQPRRDREKEQERILLEEEEKLRTDFVKDRWVFYENQLKQEERQVEKDVKDEMGQDNPVVSVQASDQIMVPQDLNAPSESPLVETGKFSSEEEPLLLESEEKPDYLIHTGHRAMLGNRNRIKRKVKGKQAKKRPKRRWRKQVSLMVNSCTQDSR